MANIKVRIEANRFREIADAMRPRLQEIKREAAEGVVERAQANVHVLSGDLKESIHVEEDGLDFLAVAGRFYAGFVEFGTRHAAAFPFMKPARDAVLPEFEAGVREVIK